MPGDAAVAEGLDVEDVVGADVPEVFEEFLVVRAGQSIAAGAFFVLGGVFGRGLAAAGAAGLFFIPGIFDTAVGPVLFEAAEGVGVGALGEGFGVERGGGSG